MRMYILARNPELYSHQRLVQAAQEQGHTIEVLDTGECYINISETQPNVHYKNDDIIADADAIIPRIGVSLTHYGTAILRQFEMKGIYSINSSIAISRARDKLRSLQLLAKYKIPMPITGFAHSPKSTESIIKMVGGAPLIIKLLEGTQGKGVILAETQKAAKSVIQAFKQVNTNILVQEYIQESGGSDIRCMVLGKKVIAAYKRIAGEGEFRANLHQGGRGEPIKITPFEREIAVKAAHAMGLRLAGVEYIRSNNGPLVLEVNSSPGLEGIERVSGVDIAGAIIRYIEKHANNKKEVHL